MGDTIYAVSSGRPPAALAVIRISGPAALAAGEALAGSLPAPRRAGRRRLRSTDGGLLDDAVVVVFPGPRSATGEDVVELHCHGGRAVVAAVEQALADMPRLRSAEPGEFTRRALMHGRIDLAEAQGLADLLAAETEAQRLAAIGAVEGRVSRAVEGWLSRVAALSARAEALLDFADEDDVGADEEMAAGIARGMVELADELDGALSIPSVERLRDGIRVVLAGRPNSGKSTLLNLLVEREVAIVSPIAGTTRDRIEVGVTRAGLPYLLSDTAGLAEGTADPIEAIGVDRARLAIEEADILVWLDDQPPPRVDAVWVHSRADEAGRIGPQPGHVLSVRRDRLETIDRLWSLIASEAGEMLPRPDQLALHDEQRRRLADAVRALRQCWSDPLIGAELLRQAHGALSAIVGRNATEAMLDALFGQFCIGK